LLKSLVELDASDARLQGSLPSEWTNPFGLRTVAAAALQAARHADAEAPVAELAPLARGYAQAEAAAAMAELVDASTMHVIQHLANDSSSKGNPSVDASDIQRSTGGVLLTRLQVLKLRNNNFSGELPASWHLLPSLRVLDVSMTTSTRRGSLAGYLPAQYALLQKLQVGLLS
jgi:hypothetical protein